jgi:PGF-pre-PGF domain-containing protein
VVEPKESDTTSVEKEYKIFLADDLVVEENNELKEENIALTLKSTIGNISKDRQISVKTSVQEKTKTTIQQVDFTTSSDQENVELTVSNLKNKPVEVTKEISMKNTSKVYKYLDIKLTSDGQYIRENGISTMTFTFAVEKTWIENENIDKQSVEMMRCHNNTWQHLNSTYLNESETVIYYQAETPGLSVFAVVGSTNVMSSDTYAPETANIPLEAIFGIVTAIVALLIIVLFKARYIYFGEDHPIEKSKKIIKK